jgi:hypothetical protein
VCCGWRTGQYATHSTLKPGKRNLLKKEAGMSVKCKDLTVEIQRMWGLKTKVIAVIIWATGIILK